MKKIISCLGLFLYAGIGFAGQTVNIESKNADGYIFANWKSTALKDLVVLINQTDHKWKAQIHVYPFSAAGITLIGECNGSDSYKEYHVSPSQSIECTIDISKPLYPMLQFHTDKENTVAQGEYKIFDVPT